VEINFGGKFQIEQSGVTTGFVAFTGHLECAGTPSNKKLEDNGSFLVPGTAL
jgi:hypothetical protein